MISIPLSGLRRLVLGVKSNEGYRIYHNIENDLYVLRISTALLEMKNLLTLVLFLTLSSCSVREVETDSQPVTEVETFKWSEENLRGYSYELEGRKGYLGLKFSDNGRNVATTIGELDSWITEPVRNWRIATDGALMIEGEQ